MHAEVGRQMIDDRVGLTSLVSISSHLTITCHVLGIFLASHWFSCSCWNRVPNHFDQFVQLFVDGPHVRLWLRLRYRLRLYFVTARLANATTVN